MEKYYTFDQQAPKYAQWMKFVFSKASNFCVKVEVFKELGIYSDKEERVFIEKAIKYPKSHFKGIEPTSVTVTMKPFFKKQNSMSLVYTYDYTPELEKHTTKKWSKDIKKDEGLGIEAFVMFGTDAPFFFYDPYTDISIILLALGEVDVASSYGIKLKEYDIKLNDTLDINNDLITY